MGEIGPLKLPDHGGQDLSAGANAGVRDGASVGEPTNGAPSRDGVVEHFDGHPLPNVVTNVGNDVRDELARHCLKMFDITELCMLTMFIILRQFNKCVNAMCKCKRSICTV